MELLPDYFPEGFGQEGFGCGYLSFILKGLSFYRAKTNNATDIRSRCVAEAQTYKR
jgi:hypothetical protein